jgi:hypothetical protein
VEWFFATTEDDLQMQALTSSGRTSRADLMQHAARESIAGCFASVLPTSPGPRPGGRPGIRQTSRQYLVIVEV